MLTLQRDGASECTMTPMTISITLCLLILMEKHESRVEGERMEGEGLMGCWWWWGTKYSPDAKPYYYDPILVAFIGGEHRVVQEALITLFFPAVKKPLFL